MEQHKLHFQAANHYPSACAVRIYRQSNVVVATDIDEGSSVTNSCEVIADEVVRQFGLNPRQLFFIEEYRPNGPNHTTDLVQFDINEKERGSLSRFRHPRWSPISEDEFAHIIQLAEEIETMT